MIDTYEEQDAYEKEFAGQTKDDAPAKPVDLDPIDEPTKPVSLERAAMDEERGADAKAFSDAFNNDGTKAEQPKAASTFKEAFASARKGGLKVFEFGGKKYTTEMKGAKAAKPAVKSEAPSAASQVPAPREDKVAKPLRYESAQERGENFAYGGSNPLKVAKDFLASGGANLSPSKAK